ncbi:MAG: ThuA domain-containing protein, partial [Bacteroidetes bacterium]|nr:ThuA domain-containing protein [Bacteroidota bacterium]
SYTHDPNDLNKENLDKFDALILYANHDSISASQEKALLSYVRGGKGFLPVHCASFCFRNSDEFVKMVGAQFKSHKTATFTTEIVNKNHPVTSAFQSFETWDETYVHHLHNDDRTVLMERVEGDHREPWTWVREEGKGRIFYTAYGHDERTWSNPGFLDLMERAILWAVDEKVVENWTKLTFPKHEYTAKENIPNYEKRDPAPMFQEPFSQPESEKFIQVHPDFELKVFASEPDIINPIAMAWDEKGRLWIAETIDYPNEVKENQQGDDRIKICEDTDGDGKADKFTVFADGLNIPTSLVFAQGGIIVSQAPDFLFLADTDGDDKADVRETLITGWGTYDTHAGPSNLKYGFDNKIWGTVGYSGFEGTIAGKERKFRQGFYRFSPDASEFEFLTSTSNNTWGLGFSETFDVFGSTANNAHSWYMAIPNRYYEGIEGLNTQGSKKIADYYNFHPITENVRQVDVFGGFTAAAGHNLYTARDFPKSYWNRMALVCEPTGHLLAQGLLEKDGAGFSTKDAWNLLASADEWVSPVHAEVGPDGAVWVADWYNFIIQHNPTPSP